MSEVHPAPPVMEKIAAHFNLRNAAAVAVGDVLFTSGIGSFDLETGETLPGDDIRTHAMHSLDVYEQVLEELGLGIGLDNVVKVTAYLRHPERDYAAWNQVYHERFRDPYPCRTTVGGGLVAGIVELDLTVALTPRTPAGS